MLKSVEVMQWDRQPGESLRAFEAFSIYRDLLPSERSVEMVATALLRSGSMMSKYCQRWAWVERTSAWDAHIDRLKQRTVEEDVVARRIADRQRERAMGLALIEKAMLRIETMTPEQVAASQVPNFLRSGMEILRLADNLATDKTETTLTGADGAPLHELTDEALAAMVEDLVSKLKRKEAPLCLTP